MEDTGKAVRVTSGLAAIAMVAASTGPTVLAASGSVASANVGDPYVAGYEVTSTASTQSAGATFVVPALICSGWVEDMMWIGSFVIPDPSTDNATSGSAVVADCHSGSPILWAAYLQGGQYNTFYGVAVHEGDTIKVSVTQSGTAVAVKIRNVTTGQHAIRHFSAPTAVAASVGVNTFHQCPGCHPIPPFMKIRMTNATLNGMSLGAAGASAVNLEPNPPKLQIRTSALSKSGKAFTETFVSN